MVKVFFHPGDLDDEQCHEAAAEAARRGLIDVDLSDVQPERLAAALASTPEGRSAMARMMSARRTVRGRDPIPELTVAAMQADRDAGMKLKEIARKHKVSLRTVSGKTEGKR